MGLVGLHQYLDRVEELLEARQIEEASKHCLHIVDQAPKFLDSSRLLGRIYLEQQMYDEALKLFVQVLRVDPEDLIAHAGRGLAYKELGDVSKAIWHLERAAEIDAYNVTVQEELNSLYNQADGYQPKKKELTQAAIARLRVIGGLYSQAETDLNEVINESPDRYDLKVLQAEALYLDDKTKDAAKASGKILKVLPECIKANAILGLAYIQLDNRKAAQRIAIILEPYTKPDRATLDKDSLFGKFLLALNPQAIPERTLIEEYADPGFAPPSDEDTISMEVHEEQSTTETGVPSWLLTEKVEEEEDGQIVKSREEEIDEIDDVIEWLEAIAAEEGSLFTPDSESKKKINHNDEDPGLSRNRSDITRGYSTDQTLVSKDLTDEKEGKSTYSQGPRTSTKSTSPVTLTVEDYEEDVPQWLDEVIGFTDNLKLENQLIRSETDDNQRVLGTAMAGGIMSSLFLENSDSQTLANLEERAMYDSNEFEQEHPDESTSAPSDDEWLDELGKKTNEEFAGGLSLADSDVEDLGEIDPGQEIPEWLAEELKADPDDDDATPSSGISPEEIEEALKAQESEMSTEKLTSSPIESGGDDLDWLDQLAAEDVQLSDIESTTEESDSPEVSNLAAEIPDDPDEAIAWLEELADQEDTSEPLITDVAPAADGQLGEGIEVVLPVDEGEASQWLEEFVALKFAEQGIAPQEEMLIIEEPATPQASLDVAAAQAEAEKIMLEESQEVELVDSEIADEIIVSSEGEDQIQNWLDDLDVAEADQEIEDQISLDDEFVREAEAAQEDIEVESEENEFDWLDTIEVPDDEESAFQQDSERSAVDESDLVEAIDISSGAVDQLESVEHELVKEQPQELTDNDPNLFYAAETALNAGEIGDAVANYRMILDSKEDLPDLIAALESAVDQNDNQPSLKRILGEAYTENGQLQKALEMYRRALEDI